MAKSEKYMRPIRETLATTEHMANGMQLLTDLVNKFGEENTAHKLKIDSWILRRWLSGSRTPEKSAWDDLINIAKQISKKLT